MRSSTSQLRPVHHVDLTLPTEKSGEITGTLSSTVLNAVVGAKGGALEVLNSVASID